MRRPRLTHLASLLLLWGCSGEQQGAPPGHLLGGPGGPATEYSLTLKLPPGPDLPKKAKLVFIGFSEDQVEGNHPKKGTIPAFYWKSGKLKLQPEIVLDVPLPESINLLVVVDFDGDGKPNPDERSTALLLDFKAGESPVIAIDRAFADLGGPPRNGPPRDLVIDATRVEASVDAKEVRVLVLGYEVDLLRNGMPRAGAMPGFLWTSEPTRFGPEIRLTAPVPDIPGLDAIVMLDTDGDGLPSPDEPISRAYEDFKPPPEGTAWSVEVDRTFQPARTDRTRTGAPTGGESEGVAVRLELDAKPRIKLQRATRLMVVGFEDDDIEDGRPMSDAEPSFLWWRDEPDIDWPLIVEGRLPATAYLVVMDLDENNKPTAGDLTTGLQKPPDPKAAAQVSVVLDRTLTFADGEDDGDEEDDAK